MDDATAHCLAKILDLVGRESPSRRDLMQLGYNLGRLSETTGLGRGPFWDRWKGPVDDWDRDALDALARELSTSLRRGPAPIDPTDSSGRSPSKDSPPGP